jgi:hypothetical protein
MANRVYSRFMELPEERRLAIMMIFGFPVENKDYSGFLRWVKQEGKSLDLMWILIDPLNPIDPRYVC